MPEDEEKPVYFRANDDAPQAPSKQSQGFPPGESTLDTISGFIAGYSSPNVVLTVYTTQDNPASKYVRARPPAINVGSDMVTSRIRKWLRECQEGHKMCGPKKIPRLPTRVLDIGESIDNSDVHLHISQPEERAEYATLSYCWGSSNPEVFTSTDRLARMTHNVSFLRLSQTIQDAITTVRKLGFHYLWVDSLCIVQDSEEDKTAEIDVMGDIYRLSSLTIAAASSSEPIHGFLYERSEIEHEEVDLPLYIPEGTCGRIALTPLRSNIRLNEPLQTRGWALQESLMSSRLLVYGEWEVLWHCETETYKRVVPTYFGYADQSNPLSLADYGTVSSLPLSKSTLGGSRHYSPYEKAQFWANIITNYSRREMKHESDRLPALTGIVQAVSRATDGEYLAGLWNHCLVYQLCWYRDIESSFYPDKTMLERRPSWSWISLFFPCDVRFYRVNTIDVAVLDCTVQPLHADAPYGEITAGKLTLQGKLISIDGPADRLDVRYDREQPEKSELLYWLLVGWITWAPDATRPKSSTIKDSRFAAGLILHRSNSGYYKRVGCFRYREPNQGPGSKKVWKKTPTQTVHIE